MIPRVLHRTVPASVPEAWERWWTDARMLMSGWEFRTYREPLDPDQWETARHWGRCESGAQKAGLVRLEALLRDGGVYVDGDVEIYRPFDPLLGLPAFAGWEDATVVPDAVLGAEAGHPAIAACLSEAVARLDWGTWKSGPGVTTELLPGRDDVLCLPPGAFYPYHYDHKEERDRPHRDLQPWAFCAHHWAGTWLDR